MGLIMILFVIKAIYVFKKFHIFPKSWMDFYTINSSHSLFLGPF